MQMMLSINKRFLFISLLLLAMLFAGCEQANVDKPPQQPLALKLGMSSSIFVAPLNVAEAKGYFAEEGLDVEIKRYKSGKATLDGLLKGETEIGTAADAPLAKKGLSCDCFRILATFMSSPTHGKIVARKSHGIDEVSDLKGKKIGLTKGTTGEFFAKYSLLANQLDIADVEIINLPTKQLVNALQSGQVDAISTWEPNGYLAQKALQDDAVVFVDIEVLRHTFNLVTKPNNLLDKNNIEKYQRLLKVIQRGSDFINQHPDEAAQILSGFLNISEKEISTLLVEYQVGLKLDNLLLSTMEIEGDWILQQAGKDHSELPNYSVFIDKSLLEKLYPKAVTLIQ